MVHLSSFTAPVEGIQHFEENVKATVESSVLGTGNLYITESCVMWLNENQDGMQLEYKLISLHALSSPKEHLLLHYDAKLPFMRQDSESSSGEEDGGEPEMCLTQINFKPENVESLDAMFSALSSCQALHPDSDCELSGEEEFEDAEEIENMGDGYFTDESGFQHLNEEGRANLERFNQMLSGQGDADLAARTNQLTLVNGGLANGHANGEEQNEHDQFQDVDDEMGN